MRQYRLHEMHLHSDFVETLCDMGKIPKVNLDHVQELTQEKQKQEAKNKELVKKLKQALADPDRRDSLMAKEAFKKMIQDDERLKVELGLEW